MTSTARARQSWRETIETAVVAVSTALVLKYFALEPFEIPTGSMQPTLMGLDTSRGRMPSSGVRVFDRLLVDKVAPYYCDPKRWEVWVFLFPLDKSNRYIKRVVGLPGEELKLAYGDVFVRRSEKEEWRIARKPDSVQRDAWREVWSTENGKSASDFWDANGFAASADGSFACQGAASLTTKQPIIDGALHGYPPALQAAMIASGRVLDGTSVVRDLRVRLRAEANAQFSGMTLSLDWGGDALRAFVSGPTGDGKIQITFNEKPVGSADARLRPGVAEDVEFWRADEAFGISINGAVVARSEFVSTHRPEKFSVETSTTNRVRIETAGGSLQIRRIAVDRDLHYANRLPGLQITDSSDPVTRASQPGLFETVQIPEGHYFMLGDNSTDSIDGRFWKEQSLDLNDPDLGRIKIDGGLMTSGANATTNPRPGPGGAPGEAPNLIFRDHFGEEYRYTTKTGRLTSPIPRSLHTVPRESFVGRAFAVFWPFPPASPVFRWKWIR